MQTETIKTKGSRSEGKGYIAEITGLSTRYGFEREFLSAISVDGNESTFAVEPGKVYEVKVSGVDKLYYVYDGKDEESLEPEEVVEHLNGKPLSEILVFITV